ncbi:MAG: ABC transporter substrate-binding protein [Polyangiaceae bacterium]|nr:ABC transporter substrate-binding protein [Polyangiaceae bacterium]
MSLVSTTVKLVLQPTRRDLLRVWAASLAFQSFASCQTRGRERRANVEDGRVVVAFWYAFGDAIRKVLLELVAAFNSSQPRVLVRPVHQGDYFEALAKLRTAIAAGAAPPLSHVVLEVLPYLARAGVLEPLDRYDGARAIPFVPALTQAGAFAAPPGEPLAGIPFNRSTPIAFANGQMLAEAGVAPPATWEELASAASALTRRGPDGETRWGFEVPISWWYWVAMTGQAGGRLVMPDGQVTLGGRAGEDALRFWQRLVRDDRVMRPPPGRDYQAWQSTNDSFLRRRVAMMWSSTAYVRYLEDNASFPVQAAPLPRQSRASVPTGGTMFVILRGAPEEEKQAAWEFVRWMCEREQASTWAARTGYLPVTMPAVDHLVTSGFYARHPNHRVAYDQLANVDPWPWAPELFRIERDVVEPRLEDAVLTGRDAREVLEEARDDARRPA